MLAIKKGATDRSVELLILNTDGTPKNDVVWNSAGIDLWYRRDGGAKVSITEASLSALTDAHADGGFLLIGDGVYRLDLPDAAFATGANKVVWGGTVTSGIITGGAAQLVDYDPQDTVRLGLTALPNAAADAAGGLPISDAGGLDLDARLDASVSSRATAAALATVDGIVDDILVDTAAIDARLPSDPADQSLIIAATDAIMSRLGAPAGASMSADLAAILAAVTRGEEWTGTLAGIADGTVTLGSGHGIAADSRILVVLKSGTAAKGRARFAVYSGSGDVWNVDPAWNSDGEATPSGSITAVVYAIGKAAAADLAATADAVWDEALAGHAGAGSAGAALSAAGSAGDPWSTPIPGAYGAGTAGERLGRIPNAAAGGNGGLPTVDANNRIAGIQGTITTLDALDTAQDAQHAATQARLPAALVSGRIAAVAEVVSDKTGYALTSGERTAIANVVEAEIIDDADSEKVLQAITNKIAEANPDLSGLTLGAIASAIRTELAVELALLDAAVSSRASAANMTTLLGYVDTEVAAILSRVNALPEASEVATAVRSNLASVSSAEPTGVPATNAPIEAKLAWLFNLARNAVEQTTTEQRVKNDAGTVIAVAPVTDAGGVTTRGEFAAP